MTTEALTPEKLDALEWLLEAATPGPWRHVVLPMERGGIKSLVTDQVEEEGVVAPAREEDGALIAELRNAAPALLAIARREERLREALKGLLAEVEWWEDSDTPYLIYAQMNVEAWREARAALTPEEGQAPE